MGTWEDINSSQLVTIPEEVEVSVKARKVTVKGARGTLEKEFRHLAVDIYMVDKQTLKVEMVWKEERAGSRQDCLQPHQQHDQRSHHGVHVQDASCIRAFPHQLRHQ